MYVTPFPLVAPFRSILAKCLNVGVSQVVQASTTTTGTARRWGQFLNLGSTLLNTNYSQRIVKSFLAVDPGDGATYSVGFRHAELVSGGPSCASVAPLLPGTTLDVDGRNTIWTTLQCTYAERSATNERMEDGRLRALAVLTVRRRELALLCDVAPARHGACPRCRPRRRQAGQRASSENGNPADRRVRSEVR